MQCFLKKMALLSAWVSVAHFGFLFSDDKTSKTVFIPRSFLTDSTYDNALNNFRTFTQDFDGKEHVAYGRQATSFMMQPFYSGSENHKGLARYFLFDDKTQLHVTEKPGGDVAADYLGLSAVQGKFFDATFKIRPERTALGAILSVHGNLDNILNGLYVEGRAPFVRVRHDMKFKDLGTVENLEVNVQGNTQNFNLVSRGSDPIIATVINAFDQPAWLYGKISYKKLVADGIDDALVRVGYSIFDKSNILLNLYGDFILPLGESLTGEYLFEPKVGSEHFGIGIGVLADGLVYSHNKHKLSVIGDARYHHRFSAPEKRSFDLSTNGPWSRYLFLARQYASDQSIDGVNVLTRDVDVHPHGAFELLGMLHYQHLNLHLDIGWNFWTRENESVEINDVWESDFEQLGIFSQTSFGPAGNTASTTNIAIPLANATPDPAFVRILESNFNLNSAAHERTISNKFFAGVSFSNTVFNFPSRIGFGGSYELGTSNTALDQWSVWLNGMIQF